MQPQSEVYPLTEAQTLIVTILDSFMKTTNDHRLRDQYESFKSLTLYGTNEDTDLLFVPADIRKILNIQQQISFSEYIKGVEIVRECTVVKDGHKQKMDMLTECGVYRMFMTSRSKFADIFRTFIYLVLRGLKQKGKVELIEVKRQLEHELEEERIRTDSLSTVLANQSILKFRMQQYYKAVADPGALDIANADFIYYQFLEETKTTEVRIYLAVPSIVHKAKVKRNDDDSDQEEPVNIESVQYSLEEYDAMSPDEFSSDLLIYYIPAFKGTKIPNTKHYRPVGTIHFIDKSHYDNFIDTLSHGSCKLKKKNHFYTSMDSLVSMRGECLVPAWQELHAKKNASISHTLIF